MARNRFRFIFLCIGIVVLVLNIYYFLPQMRQHFPYYKTLRTYAILLFRNPYCSFNHALKGLSYGACQQKNYEIISQSCKILKKDEKGFVLWDTCKGPVWAPPGSELTSPYFPSYIVPVILAEQDCNVYGTGSHAVQPGDIVLDCGAHIGLYTKKALADGAKMVVAIEPSPDNIECLHRNFSKEINTGRVIVYPKGVWHQEEELSFAIRDQSARNEIIQEQEKGVQMIHIPVTTIDNIVSELKLEKVDFIKMDIEGAEQNALRGAKKTIAAHHPRMAIATEHTNSFLENSQKVAAIIQGVSDYCVECGKVEIMGNPSTIHPTIVFFY